jgi:multiple sugar transport system substrate-binding protein
MRRTTTAAALIALTLGATAACGNNGGGGGSSSGALTAHGPIKIWMSNNPEEITWAKAMVVAWNTAHPKEVITAQEIPAGKTSEEVIGAAITAGNAPCLVFNTSPAAIPQFQKQGGLVALDSFSDGKSYVESRTGAAAAQYRSPDGKFYQIPWKSNPVMIFYNKDIMKKAGIDPANPPLGTYDEFLATSEKIVSSKAAQAAIYPAPTSEFFQSWFDFYPLYAAESGGKQLVEAGKATFDSTEGKAVANFWKTMYDKGLAPKEKYNGDSFADKKAAMAIVGPWAIAVYNGKVNWGVAPVPTSSGKPADEIKTFSDAKNVAIYSACQNQGTAWDVLKFATSKDQDGSLLEKTGQMPLRTDLPGVYPQYFSQHPEYKIFASQAARTVEVPNVPSSITIWLFRGHLRQILRRRRTEAGRRQGESARSPILNGGAGVGTSTVSQTSTDPPDSPPLRPVRRREAILGRQPLGIAFAAPYAIFLLLVFAYPLGLAIWISFHDYFFAAPGAQVARPFVGLDNYRAALSDPAVRRSFLNVLEFLVINVPLTVVLSLLLATALNGAVRGRTFLRVAYFVPYITASVAVVAVWLFLFSGGGLVNQLLGGLAPNPSWLVNGTLAMPVIAFFVTWKQLGFFILIYLAALQNVPKELYEAASVDGAGRFRSLTNVTLPGVRPATILVVILATITGANLFTEPYLLTNGGGPDGASTSPVFVMYQKGIEQGAPDVASAIGVLLVVAVLLISLLSRRLLGGD